MSWEVEEMLKEQGIKFEAMEEILTSTGKIFEISNQNPSSMLDIYTGVADGFTETVNVVAISSTLIATMIKNRKR